MASSTTIKLKNIDSEDISDVLKKIEKSFGFKFDKTELKDVKTFGNLCDIITNKVQGDNVQDCTTQQAFYKLRDAIATLLLLDKNKITLDTALQELFARYKRKQQIKNLEKTLGFKIKVLRPKHWVTTAFILTLLASIVGLFIYWQVALISLALSFAGLFISDKIGIELDLKTEGQLAEKITREHYIDARRNQKTINRTEIAKTIKELFRTDLDLEEEVLNREATFM